MVSPTSVAAPSIFEKMATLITIGIGDIFNFLATIMVIGTIIKTVATLSTNADIIPAKIDNDTINHFVFGTLFIIVSDNSDGIFDSINNDTIPMVPVIINNTLKSISLIALSIGIIPIMIKIIAIVKAMYDLYFGMVNIKIYVKTNNITANNCMFILITSINFILVKY